ncbi:hypothetical protein BD408DRAFT_465524 [Parasitella parasitica]|nr:hypothetical protein BD408DRAFT_465524 [Parasitella parasitica]
MSFYSDTQYKKAPFNVQIVKFGCENCGRRWQSANGSLKDYQKCKRCFQKCYPSSYKIMAPNKRGNENRGSFQAHNTELCGRCDRLGYSCMELGNNSNEDTLVVSGSNNEEVLLLTKTKDLSSFVSRETPKTSKPKQAITSVISSKASGQKQADKRDDTRKTEDRIFALDINEKIMYDVNDNAPSQDYHYYDGEELMFGKSFISCDKNDK